MTNTIRRELRFPQSLEKVWNALTNSAALAEWMFPNDFEPRVGHRFTFRVPGKAQPKFDGLTVHCEILACVPHSELVFTWATGELNTRVSYRLEPDGPDGSGTRVLFEHAGFELEQRHAFKGAEYGWKMMQGKLAALLEGSSDATDIRREAT